MAQSPDPGTAPAPTPSSGISAMSDWAPDSNTAATPFDAEVDEVLHQTAALARALVGAHQGAASLIVRGDWKGMRKYFSLSPKYAAWFAYRTPAVGFGIHATVVQENSAINLTEPELEARPDWKAFGIEASKHPPMRGWLAVPLIGRDGRNYGLLQLSDKYADADFTPDDEARLTHLAKLTGTALDALCRLYHDDTLGHPRA